MLVLVDGACLDGTGLTPRPGYRPYRGNTAEGEGERWERIEDRRGGGRVEKGRNGN